MTLKANRSLAAILAIALVLTVYASTYYVARANPSDLNTSNANATSTISYLTPGTATTTYAYDSYANGVADPNGTDSATLLVQFTASSTASILNARYEYSQGVNGVDCLTTPNACDWYSDNLNALATTSWANPINTPSSFSWTFASTTQGGGAVSTSNNRALKAILVTTPTRYVRAIFTVPVGATNGGVWATFVAKKQQPE